MIYEDNIPRNQWKKSIITRTLPETDNETRVVEERTANSVLIRPVRIIIRLIELKNSEFVHGGEDVPV